MKASRSQDAVAAKSSNFPEPIEKATPRVPAYSAVEPEAKALPATLSADQFFGSAREGYQKAKEIPQILAQLPCYCDCDLHMGHKSLHSCFETDHAAHCSVCLNEALEAYTLKKEGLSSAKIRERIIAEYSTRH
jgi:hypothetical protein